MNIAFLDSIEASTYGGMEEWIRLVAGGLRSRGHSITIIGRTESRFLERVRSTEPSVQVEAIRIGGDFDPLTIARLKRILAEKSVELLSVNFNKDVRLGGLAAILNGDTRVVWSLGLNITKDKAAHRWLTPKLVNGVVVPSESLKSEVVASGYIDPSLVEVIPIGIPDMPTDCDRNVVRSRILADHGLPDECTIAVTVGRFVEHKGHRYLIEAASEITKRFPAVRFLFLGDGPLEGDLRSRIGAAGLSDHFTFGGMVSDVAKLLPGADVMIHPSVQEPFGIAVLEGMRAGLPVVASRVGGIPEVVDEGSSAILCEPGQAASLENAVTHMLESQETMREMGRTGYNRWQKNFHFDQMINRVERYFRVQVSRHEV